jgi:Gpi18-like mannosyltransferase
VVSGDYAGAFADWMREIRQAHANGVLYIGLVPKETDASTFDYNCLPQYLFCFLSLFHGVSDMYLVKTASVVFDFVSAITIFRIVYEMTGNVRKSMIGLGVALAIPTVILNSAAWAQNDSIYTAFVLLSFLSVLKKRDIRTFVYVGLAFCFKQQTIFFFPFLIIMWLKNKVKIRYILLVPALYLAAMVPAAIAGRPWGNLLGIYSNQVAMFSRLSMNYPSIYTIVTSQMTNEYRSYLTSAGMMITVILMGLLAYYTYQKKFRITPEYMLTLVVFTGELITFCLPCMHERYGFIAEIFAFVYGLFGWKRMCIAIGFEALTLVTYTRYLFGSTIAYLYPLTGIMLVLILFVGYDLYQQMQKENA